MRAMRLMLFALSVGSLWGTPVMAQQQTLTIATDTSTWISADVDKGASKVQKNLPPGELLSIDFSDSVLLKIGNAGAVTLKRNGLPLPAPGKHGEVKSLTVYAQDEQAPSAKLDTRPKVALPSASAAPLAPNPSPASVPSAAVATASDPSPSSSEAVSSPPKGTPDAKNNMQALQAKADQGDEDAQLLLAEMHLKGEGVPKDEEKGLDMYRAALDMGSERALVALVRWYATGPGAPRDMEQAVNLAQFGADCQFAQGEFLLGDMYNGKIGNLPPDEKQAVHWYSRAAQQGNAQAAWELAQIYLEGRGLPQDAARGVEWLEKAATLGRADAQQTLGHMYERGRHAPQSYEKAARWHQMAVSNGTTLSMVALGGMYARGLGVPVNLEKAMELLRQAEAGGSPSVHREWGLLAEHGLGVPKDNDKAMRRFKLAAESNDELAMYHLGRMYEAGKDSFWGQWFPKKDEALGWYTRAAEKGSTEARLRLAHAALTGSLGQKDVMSAFQWYSAAAAVGETLFAPDLLKLMAEFQALAMQGQADMQVALGTMFAKGHGVAVDEAEAFKWYGKAAAQNHAGATQAVQDLAGSMVKATLEKWPPNNEAARLSAARSLTLAADNGHTLAQLKLAEMYELGLYGVERDSNMALTLYKKAAGQSVDAAFRLGDIYSKEAFQFGVTQQPEEAMRWYQQAAQAKGLPAYIRLGQLEYEAGRNKAALQWLSKANPHGNGDLIRTAATTMPDILMDVIKLVGEPDHTLNSKGETLLFDAVRKNDLRLVQTLLKARSRVHSNNEGVSLYALTKDVRILRALFAGDIRYFNVHACNIYYEVDKSLGLEMLQKLVRAGNAYAEMSFAIINDTLSNELLKRLAAKDNPPALSMLGHWLRLGGQPYDAIYPLARYAMLIEDERINPSDNPDDVDLRHAASDSLSLEDVYYQLSLIFTRGGHHYWKDNPQTAYYFLLLSADADARSSAIRTLKDNYKGDWKKARDKLVRKNGKKWRFGLLIELLKKHCGLSEAQSKRIIWLGG